MMDAEYLCYYADDNDFDNDDDDIEAEKWRGEVAVQWCQPAKISAKLLSVGRRDLVSEKYQRVLLSGVQFTFVQLTNIIRIQQ
jgi:hypothetical protein